jgi:hypothetical protein
VKDKRSSHGDDGDDGLSAQVIPIDLGNRSEKEPAQVVEMVMVLAAPGHDD